MHAMMLCICVFITGWLVVTHAMVCTCVLVTGWPVVTYAMVCICVLVTGWPVVMYVASQLSAALLLLVLWCCPMPTAWCQMFSQMRLAAFLVSFRSR